MTRPDRLRLIGGSLALFVVALIGRAAYVQLWQRGTWTARADRQHYADADQPAPRGRILDATGFVLATLCDTPPNETVGRESANVLVKALTGNASLQV